MDTRVPLRNWELLGMFYSKFGSFWSELRWPFLCSASLSVNISSLLKHDNIVQVYGCYFDGVNIKGIVMEYVPHCLRDPSTRKNIWKILMDIAVGLQHIHSQGYIHRDLKENHILVSTLVPYHIRLSFGESPMICLLMHYFSYLKITEDGTAKITGFRGSRYYLI